MKINIVFGRKLIKELKWLVENLHRQVTFYKAECAKLRQDKDTLFTALLDLADANAALEATCAEQNLLLGQLVYDDPDFDGAEDVLASVNWVRQAGAETARAELQRRGAVEQADWGCAITPSAQRPLFYLTGYSKKGLV